MVTNDEELLTEDETATMLKVAVDTIRTWRYTRRHNLPWVKVGRLVRYKRSDVAAWIRSRTIVVEPQNVNMKG